MSYNYDVIYLVISFKVDIFPSPILFSTDFDGFSMEMYVCKNDTILY